MLTSNLAAKRLHIFDFDGTLADSSPLHEKAFKKVLEPFELPFDYSDFAGRTTRDALSSLFHRHSILLCDDEIDALVLQKQVVVRELFRDLRPIPYSIEYLKKLSNLTNATLALVSSGSRGTVNLGLEVLALSSTFDIIICGDDVSSNKPNPDGFLMALMQSGVSSSEAVVYEDSEAGFEAARRAAIDYIDVTKVTFQNILLDLSRNL